MKIKGVFTRLTSSKHWLRSFLLSWFSCIHEKFYKSILNIYYMSATAFGPWRTSFEEEWECIIQDFFHIFFLVKYFGRIKIIYVQECFAYMKVVLPCECLCPQWVQKRVSNTLQVELWMAISGTQVFSENRVLNYRHSPVHRPMFRWYITKLIDNWLWKSAMERNKW